MKLIFPPAAACTAKLAKPPLKAPYPTALQPVAPAPRPKPAGPNNIVAPTVKAILPNGDLATDLIPFAIALGAEVIFLKKLPNPYCSLSTSLPIPPEAYCILPPNLASTLVSSDTSSIPPSATP